MIVVAGMILAAAFVAPGDLYRCTSPSGALSFQDRPCTTGTSAQMPTADGGNAPTEVELHEWLQQLPANRKRESSQKSAARVIEWAGNAPPLSERSLAICSERFLACASNLASRMDACVAATPRCNSSIVKGCCPADTLNHFQHLRRLGVGLSNATREALLGADLQ